MKRQCGGQRKTRLLEHPLGRERCFFVVTGSTASGHTDSRKGWSPPVVPLSWQEIKGKYVENEFLEEREKKKSVITLLPFKGNYLEKVSIVIFLSFGPPHLQRV